MQHGGVFGYGNGGANTLVTGRVQIGEPITGVSTLNSLEYHESGFFQTGEYRLVEEGKSCLIKNVYVRTYSNDKTSEDEAPYVILKVRPVDSDTWLFNSAGTCSVTTTTCTFTNAISANCGVGTGAAAVFATPATATKCRIYVNDVLQTLTTHYTITGAKQITFVTPPTLNHVIRAVWSGYPTIKLSVGDFVETSQGFHRILTAPTPTTVTLDWYPSTTLTGTHIQAKRASAGTSEVKFPIQSHLNSLQLRGIIIPADHAEASTVVKVAGFNVEFLAAEDRHMRNGGV